MVDDVEVDVVELTFVVHLSMLRRHVVSLEEHLCSRTEVLTLGERC